MKKLIYILLLPVVFLFDSCSSDKCDPAPNVSDISMDIQIERLDQQLFSLKSKSEIKDFLDSHEGLKQGFFQVDQYPHDSVLVNSIYRIINDPHIDTLYQETQLEFQDLSDLETEFEQAFRYIKHYYPQFEPPKIQTVVSGLASDLLVTDSLIVIGLDYFIGSQATFTPVHLPNYILKRYQRPYIVPSIVLLMSGRFNNTNYKDQTMLAEMVYYGKAHYFAKQMLPCTSDSLLIFYTSEEIRGVEENQNVIWANFIQNELLFETNHATKEKFLGERPKVYEIGDKCPGRIGRWIGWQIVEKYADQQDVGLKQLMQSTDAQKIFKESKYKPG